MTIISLHEILLVTTLLEDSKVVELCLLIFLYDIIIVLLDTTYNALFSLNHYVYWLLIYVYKAYLVFLKCLFKIRTDNVDKLVTSLKTLAKRNMKMRLELQEVSLLLKHEKGYRKAV